MASDLASDPSCVSASISKLERSCNLCRAAFTPSGEIIERDAEAIITIALHTSPMTSYTFRLCGRHAAKQTGNFAALAATLADFGKIYGSGQ
jgi:hypothetical protein